MDCDDDYQPQAPPMQTNFLTRTTEQPQPQQPQPPPRTLHPSRGAAPGSLSPSPSSLRPRELPDTDANIDPALRIPAAAPTSRSANARPMLHIPSNSPVQVQAQQMMLPRPPHHSPYHRPFLPHRQSQAQGAGQQRSQTTASASHVSHVRVSMSSPPYGQTNQQRTGTTVLTHQQRSPQQQAAQAPTHNPTAQVQVRTPRLPPMRTLSQSPEPTSSEPIHTSPPPTSPPPTVSGSPTSPPRPATGFVRFARAPTRFAPTLVFGESSQSASSSTPKRSSISDATHTPSSSSSSSFSSIATAPATFEGEAGSRRRFVPPPPRAGIEYAQREGGGLVTAHRASGRYDEYTIDWLVG